MMECFYTWRGSMVQDHVSRAVVVQPTLYQI